MVIFEKCILYFRLILTHIIFPRNPKPPKIYFYDNGDVVAQNGARLENLAATTLLKRLHFIEDYYGYRVNMYYVRDKDGREVDFLTTINGKVYELIEVKNSDTNVSTSLKFYADKLKPMRTVQIVENLIRAFNQGNVLVTNPIEYFKDPRNLYFLYKNKFMMTDIQKALHLG